MALSLNPTDAEELPVDSREKVIVMDCYTEMTDYGGRIDTPAPVLVLEMKTKSGYRRTRSYSAGGPDHVKANAAGNGFEPVGDSRGMPAGCNAVAFLQSLVAAGFPAGELAQGDVTALIGLELVLIEVDQPQRFTPKPKPVLDEKGQPKKDAAGKTLFEPPPPPKKYWLVSEIVGVEQHLPGLTPPHAQQHGGPVVTGSVAMPEVRDAPQTQGDFTDRTPPPQPRTVPRAAPRELAEDDIPF